LISARVSHPTSMGRAIRVALVAVLVSIAVAPYVSAQQDLTFSLFERYIDALRVQANIPGLSAASAQNGRVVWEPGLGYSDVEHAVRARRPHSARWQQRG